MFAAPLNETREGEIGGNEKGSGDSLPAQAKDESTCKGALLNARST